MKLLKILALLLVMLLYSLSVAYAFQYYFTTPEHQVKAVLKILYRGDINRDGTVNLKDLGIITGHWQQKVPPAPSYADLNGDGIVNLKDLGYITGSWQKHI